MEFSDNRVYDLIIVGGGPAGSTAALYAARKGLKTLLLDKERFPRDKVCGDALSGKAVAVLEDLELLENVRKLPGAFIQTVTFGSPNHTEVNVELKSAEGFVIRREIFDNFLFQEARKVAHRCIEEFSVRDLVMENGQVKGIRGRGPNGDQLTEFRGRIVLGADGFNSIVARKMGLYNHDPLHWVVALRCYYRNVGGLTNQIELHYLEDIIPGYFWIFPLENGYANIGIGILHEYLRRRKINLKRALDNVINDSAFEHRFAGSERVGEPVGWNLPVGSKHREIYGNGFMLLGDAAGLIDPFTGEGIGNAMYSARTAVETALEACRTGDFSRGFLSQYDDRLWDEVGDELKLSTKLQQLGRLKFLLNFIIGRASRSEEVRNVIAGMIVNKIPRRKLTNPMFYLKLLFA